MPLFCCESYADVADNADHLGGARGGWGAAYKLVMDYWEKSIVPKWKTAEVTTGDIISVVNATGSIKPKLQITVGTFVSGPIESIMVDFNREVKRATCSPRSMSGSTRRPSTETCHPRHAEGASRASESQMAASEERRTPLASASRAEQGLHLRLRNGPIQVQPYFAGIASRRHGSGRRTSPGQSRYVAAELGYTEIRSPVDGIVIDRKIDPGQTVAAPFQTPELFIVAPDMRKEMHVFASVDEADIGLVQVAQEPASRCASPSTPIPTICSRARSPDSQELDDHAERRHLPRRRVGAESRLEAAARHDGEHLVPGRRTRRRLADPQRGPALLPAAEQVRPEDRKPARRDRPGGGQETSNRHDAVRPRKAPRAAAKRAAGTSGSSDGRFCAVEVDHRAERQQVTPRSSPAT